MSKRKRVLRGCPEFSAAEGQIDKSLYVRHGKRCVDVFGAAIGLILLAPVILGAAVAVKASSKGPIFFRQTRVGRNGRLFRISKFRSMLSRSSKSDLKITVAGDSRITAVGRLLRRFKIDEIPQLWNVLIGDMSLVGPRPEVPAYVDKYSESQRGVLDVRPGITDPASLFFRSEESVLQKQLDPEEYYQNVLLDEKLSRSLSYMQRTTFRSDLAIIVQTILVVFKSSQI